jgi:hypothetical protein
VKDRDKTHRITGVILISSRTNVADEYLTKMHVVDGVIHFDDLKIVYKVPHPAAPPYSVTRTACRRLLHAHGPAAQRKRGSTGHSNKHFSKCINYKLTIRQSFAKLRKIWGSNIAGEGKDQGCMNMEERGPFIGEEG